MKVARAVLSAALMAAPASAFSPASAGRRAFSPLSQTLFFADEVETEERVKAEAPAAKAPLADPKDADGNPIRVGPDAGFMPEWEDRVGKDPSTFLVSDESNPDLAGMWECPLTLWDSEGIDVKQAQAECAKQPHCPAELRADDAANADGVEYFRQNREKIRSDLVIAIEAFEPG